MSKLPISVTIERDNVAWLKGRAGAAGLRSVSELVDRIVTAARKAGQIGPPRSVVGTVDIDPADPGLDGADAAVGALYETSLGRPLVVRETAPEYGSRSRAKKRRG